jgi:hypothetical protein
MRTAVCFKETKARAVFQLARPALEFVCIYHFQDVGDGYGRYLNSSLAVDHGPRRGLKQAHMLARNNQYPAGMGIAEYCKRGMMPPLTRLDI